MEIIQNVLEVAFCGCVESRRFGNNVPGMNEGDTSADNCAELNRSIPSGIYSEPFLLFVLVSPRCGRPHACSPRRRQVIIVGVRPRRAISVQVSRLRQNVRAGVQYNAPRAPVSSVLAFEDENLWIVWTVGCVRSGDERRVLRR